MKLKKAVYLSHNGLGDNITSIGAINFLINYYELVYMFCKKNNLENVKLFFHGTNVLFIDFDSNEFSFCSDYINNIYYNDPDIDFAHALLVDYREELLASSDENGVFIPY